MSIFIYLSFLKMLRIGEIQGTLGEAVQSFLPNYICAGLAVIPAHIIARLGRQASKAKELGSYQLGEVVRQGGMGEVHLATHRMLARPAAIKKLRCGGRLRTKNSNTAVSV